MPNITAPALTFPSRSFPAQQAGAPTGVVGELSMSQFVGKYGTLVKSQRVFYTSAIVTAPVIYSTAAQLGPMLWNRTGSGFDAHVLAISIGAPTTATSVAGSLGWASNVQPAAPTSPGTALVAVNAYAGGPTSGLGFIGSTGTVIILPVPTFTPLFPINTATAGTAMSALQVSNIDTSGMFVVGPGNVGYVCASATLTSGVMTIGIMWAEIPT
jgi:hypothetical protein